MAATSRRVFELPGIQDLSKEQETVNYLPLEGMHLIVGGPGTGKSVLALIRVRLLAAQRKDYRFLVYNVLLEQASLQLYPQVHSARWISWFNRLYISLFRHPPPRLSNNGPDIDWDSVEQRILDELPEDNPPLLGKYFVIDEGQDMPPRFYETLLALGAENIFVAADQNQQMTEFNSRIDQLQDALGLEEGQVMRLSENFRQRDKGYHVARLAREFYTDPASPPPKLPDAARASTETPWLYTYGGIGKSLETVIERILKRIQRNPKELIGIFSYKDKTRIRYLKGMLAERDRIAAAEQIAVNTYFSGMEESRYQAIHFDRGGILVINAQSCKGLEFDTVFITDIDQFPYSPDNDQTKRLFYVMISRARERIYLLRNGTEASCPVEGDGLLPKDEKILRRNTR